MKNTLDEIDKEYIIKTLVQLQEGVVSLKQIHNKKHYSKNNKRLVKVLELAIIEELFKYGR